MKVMKSEHEHRVESNARNISNVDSPPSLRGLMKPKALRGGGGGTIDCIPYSVRIFVWPSLTWLSVDHRKSVNFQSFDKGDGAMEKVEEDYDDEDDDAAWAQKKAQQQAQAQQNSEIDCFWTHLIRWWNDSDGLSCGRFGQGTAQTSFGNYSIVGNRR